MGCNRIRGTVVKANVQGSIKDIRRKATDNEHQRDIELAAMSTPTSAANHVAALQEAQDFRSSYVFLRTPKKLGEQLIADDEDPPEAWVCTFSSLYANLKWL